MGYWVAVVFLGCGVWLIVASVRAARGATKLEDEIGRYEFEHRTSGGVVQFESYEASKQHEQRRNQVAAKRLRAVLGIWIALAMLAVGAIAGFYARHAAAQDAANKARAQVLAKQQAEERLAQESRDTARGGCFAPDNCGPRAVPPCDYVCDRKTCESRGYSARACQKDCEARCRK
jgi:hypothetical protein